MNIVRIEHKASRLGPWRHPYDDSDLAVALMIHLNSDRNRWPGPGEDGLNEQLLKYTDGWYFGFESDASMLTWFNQRDLELLHGCGFQAVMFEIETIPNFTTMRGEHQIAFRKHAADKLHAMDLLGYL